MLDKSSDKYLYEQVADHIQELIKQKILQKGDRIPSVRKLKKQLLVSTSTVMGAYILLEDRGLIETRPQSGHYVKANIVPLEPNPSTPSQQASIIDTSIVSQVYADIEKPKIIKLGAAIPSSELLPIKILNRIMGKVIRKSTISHSYNSREGCKPMRQAVAKMLINAGCTISPEQIVITNGTTEAVHLALKAVTKPGDTVAIESPCYYGLLQILEALDLKALELPTDPREGISLEHLKAAFKSSNISACAVVSNFSNPLGSCMSDHRKQDLVKLVTKYNIPLIEDDIYGDLSFAGNRPKAIKAFDTEGMVLYCSSVSKTISPGLRVGWLVAEKNFVQVKNLKMVTNIMTSIVPQLTVADFFDHGHYERHLRNLRSKYQFQMQKTRVAICEYFPSQTRVTQPQGGQVLWVELPQNFEVMQFYTSALKLGISIAPGIIFSPSRSFRNCMRINCGLLWSEENEKALKDLGMLAKKQLVHNS